MGYSKEEFNEWLYELEMSENFEFSDDSTLNEARLLEYIVYKTVEHFNSENQTIAYRVALAAAAAYLDLKPIEEDEGEEGFCHYEKCSK